MNSYQFFIIFVNYAIFLNICFAKTITIENKDGKKLIINLIEVKENSFVFERTSDGKSFELSFDKISKKSKKKIKQLKEKIETPKSKKYKILFTSGKKQTHNWAGGDYDDKKQSISPILTIENRDNKRSTGKINVRIMAFGNSAIPNKKNCIIPIIDESHEIVDLKPFEKKTIKCSKKSYIFDDKGRGSEHGYSYFGYAVFLLDANDEVIEFQALPHRLTQYGKKLLKLEEKKYYDKNLKRVSKIR